MNFSKEYDYLIIGSGAAGGIVFNELKKRKKNVLLIEEGNYPKSKTHDFYYSLKNFWKYSGYQYAEGNIYLPLLQGESVGGSTRINGSIMQLLSPSFVNEIKGFLNSKSQNFQYSQLVKYQDELINELRISRQDQIEVKKSEIYKIVKNIGWDCNSQLRAELDNEIKNHIDEGNSIENLVLRKFNKRDIMFNLKVNKLIIKNNKVTGVSCVNKLNKKKILIKANKKVIICCGALGSAKLLINSKIRNKNIGRKFSCHLSGAIDSIFDHQKSIQLPSNAIEITTNDNNLKKFANQHVPNEIILSRLPIKKKNFSINKSKLISWVFNVSSESNGVLKKGIFGYKVKFNISNEQFKKIKEIIILLSNFSFNIGAQKVYPNIINKKIDVDNIDHIKKILTKLKPEELLLTASHLFGTCCFGSNSDEGVIDENFKVFNHDNLYVVDSSIFPFPTESNPQLTIMIFAKLASQIISNDE